MKIGILTYHAVCNFGANLQVLSTYEYIKSHDHEPIIINWFPMDLETAYNRKISKDQADCHKRYRERYFKMTRRCFTDQDVAKVIEENNIEAVIVGSDAVAQHHPWLSRIVFPSRKIISFSKYTEDRMCPNPFWGSFVKYLSKPIRLAMMSVSSQNSEYKMMSREEKNMINICLKNYIYISCRDNWTSKMMNYVSNGTINPVVTPDPVFAFNHNVNFIPSKKEICEKFCLPERYCLVSFHKSFNNVSVKWLLELKQRMQEKGIQCVALPFPAGYKGLNYPFDKKIELPLDPLDWYALLKYASAYIGHNMHPIVVCLHNGVPCYSFDHYGTIKLRIFLNKRSSKIYHIMSRFGVLQNHFSDARIIKKYPSVEKVMQSLLSFNVDEVKKCSDAYFNEYLIMMQNLLSSISKKCN